MKVALVYDRVNKWGGAERVLLALNEIYPQAPLYTAVYNSRTAPWAKKFRVIPSFLNHFPLAKTHHEAYPWLTPLAFESFDLSDFQAVISVTSAEAKGIITRPGRLHFCYCLTPTRYLWSGYEEYFANRKLRLFSQPLVNYLKKWDLIAAQKPDVYLAISDNVRKRIEKYYQRKAKVIYPPVDTEKWRPLSARRRTLAADYFLVVSRLVKYKKVDLAIRAFNQLGWPLKIVGAGHQLGRFKRMAQKNIEFLGQLTDKELLGYYQKCQAVIFPQEEDFGLVPLESQACGRPVIAYHGGGALESVVESKTGLFFSPQTTEALIKAVKRFKIIRTRLRANDCRQNAEKFDKKIFKKRFKNSIEEELRKRR